jgi:outer membrane protein assembly factor BamA
MQEKIRIISNGSRMSKLRLRLPVTGLLLLLLCHNAGAQVRKPFIPRTLDRIYAIVQGDSAKPYKKYYFAVPIISYKPETRWIFGITMGHIFRTRIGDSITRPSIIRMNVSYSQENQFSFRPYIDLFTRGNRFNIRAIYTYTDFAEYYWGIGLNTSSSVKELYDFRMQKLNIKAAYRFLPGWYGGIQYSYERMYDVHIPSGGLLETARVWGSTGYAAAGPGFTLYYDDRDHVYSPLNGHMIEVSGTVYFRTDGIHTPRSFQNFTLDARKYVQLWKENVLASQVYFNLNDGRPPFRMLGTLGSDVFMRGYYNGRYRENHAMAFQAELRKTIWGPIGCVFFAGGGSVSLRPSQLFDQILPNYGVGIRVKAIPRERMNIRADVGFGSKGNQAFYVTLNEAF